KFVDAYANALTPLYLYLVPLLLVGVVLACFLKEKPLQSSLGRSGRTVPPAGSGGSGSRDAGPGGSEPGGSGSGGPGESGGPDGPGGTGGSGNGSGPGESGNGSDDAGDREKAAPVHVRS